MSDKSIPPLEKEVIDEIVSELHWTPTVVSRFWKYVVITEGCWKWNGTKNTSSGYGVISVSRKNKPVNQFAHRVSWIIHYGKIANGNLICHHCDNRTCCNPAHLFSGTQKENMMDCFKKGRMPKVKNLPKGEQHCHAKLTDEKVRLIRRLHSEHGVSNGQLSKEFGVDRRAIRAVVLRETWASVI